MKSLAHSARRVKDEAGGFAPPVFRSLEAAKIRIRYGCATFIAGPPGAMKTGLALYWLLRLKQPTLFFSADGEDFEMVERAAAALTGDTAEKVRINPENYAETLRREAGHIRFVFNDSPSYEDLLAEIAAFAEVFGQMPRAICIDNLMNVIGEQENEWASMRDTARVIHKITRVTKAAVLVLHHMADDRNDPTTPAPRSKMQGKVGQLPKVILSLALSGDELRIAPVKNRWGPGDASGSTYTAIYVDPARNQFFNSHHDLRAGMPA